MPVSPCESCIIGRDFDCIDRGNEVCMKDFDLDEASLPVRSFLSRQWVWPWVRVEVVQGARMDEERKMNGSSELNGKVEVDQFYQPKTLDQAPFTFVLHIDLEHSRKDLISALCTLVIDEGHLDTPTMIVREIVERSSTNPPAPPQPPKAASKAGFPAPKRRPLPPPRSAASSFQNSNASISSASGSTRARAQADPSESGSTFNGERIPHVDFQTPHPASAPPTRPSQRVRPAPASTSSLPAGKALSETEEIQRQVEQENRARVEAMSPEEREAERAELLERFGGGLLDLMRKRRQQREAAQSSPTVPANVATEGADLGGEGEVEKVFREVDGENWDKVAKMSQETREQEIKELEEMFGTKKLDALRRRAEKRLLAKRPQAPSPVAPASRESGACTWQLSADTRTEG